MFEKQKYRFYVHAFRSHLIYYILFIYSRHTPAFKHIYISLFQEKCIIVYII